VHLGKARQVLVQPFEVARAQQRLGGDEVHVPQAGQTRDEVEIRQPQALRVGGTVEHGDDQIGAAVAALLR
jgi:hypothetical protein